MLNHFKQWLRDKFMSRLPTPDKYIEQSTGVSMASFVDMRRRLIGLTFVIPWHVPFTHEADEGDQEILKMERETIADHAAWLEVVARLSETPPRASMN